MFFRFKCDVCEKAYIEERYLNAHFKAKHSTTLNHDEDSVTTPSISTSSGGRIF